MKSIYSKIDSTKVFNLLSATDKWQSNHSTHLLHLKTIQDELTIRSVSQHVYHLREMHVCGVCRSIKLTSLRDALEDFGIPNFGQLFRMQCEDDWGHNVSGLLLGNYPNEYIDMIFIKLQNGLFCYRQPFHCPTSVECLEFDCKMKYMNGNQGIISEAHNIWVQYMQSEENDLDNTFQRLIASILGLYFSWIPLNQFLQFLE